MAARRRWRYYLSVLVVHLLIECSVCRARTYSFVRETPRICLRQTFKPTREGARRRRVESRPKADARGLCRHKHVPAPPYGRLTAVSIAKIASDRQVARQGAEPHPEAHDCEKEKRKYVDIVGKDVERAEKPFARGAEPCGQGIQEEQHDEAGK